MESKNNFINKNLIFTKMNNAKTIIGIFAGIFIVVFLVLAGKMWETVEAGEVVVIQDPIDGDLKVCVGGTTTGGLVYQNFGTPTHYKKSNQFWFSKINDSGQDKDKSIKIRFNDGGHAQMSGSVRWNMPLDEQSVIKLHIAFGSQESIEQNLVRTTIEKCIYMTGPLMSSKESYAEKRNLLLTYIDDQALLGVYKTITKDNKIKDELSGEEKTVSVVDIVQTNGIIQRSAGSPFHEFSIQLVPGSLSLNAIDYEGNVEKQIEKQQQLIMDVQTAMANSKKAEQDAITVAKQGEASAAKAKWEIEVLKSKAVTQAESDLAVQTLATKQAGLYKQQQILEGQGEAEKKRLIMSADGAIDQKLDAWKFERGKAWEAFGKFTGNLVPLYQSGGATGANGINWMEITGMNAAKQLGLDMTMPRGGNK